MFVLRQVIKLRGEQGMFSTTWTELYLMDSAQCGFDRDLDIVYLRSTAILSLAVTSGMRYYWSTSRRAVTLTNIFLFSELWLLPALTAVFNQK